MTPPAGPGYGPRVRIELICVGDELLRGDIPDAHVGYLGRRFRSMGLTPSFTAVVPDDEGAIADALAAALGRADRVILTGGLGPTTDDVTREAVAGLLKLPLHRNPEVVASIRSRFQHRDIPMPAAVERQGDVIEGFALLPNPAGTAPGQAGQAMGRDIYLLPGPPHEMRAVFEQNLAPLFEAAARRERLPAESSLLLSGVGESAVQEILGDFASRWPAIRLAYRADPGEVRVRFSSADPPELAEAVGEARRRLRACIVGEAGIDLPGAVGRLLADAGTTLATAESCTGGMLGGSLTSVAGSSAWYLGGIVAYSNDIKRDLLGVDRTVLDAFGAVSAEAARAMASGVRGRFRAGLGVAVTGIAGPGGGTEAKPVGLTYLAVAHAGGTEAVRRAYSGDRETNRRFAVAGALDLVRLTLLRLPGDPPS